MKTQTEQINPGDVVRVIETGRLIRVNQVREIMPHTTSGEKFRYIVAGSYKAPVLYMEGDVEKVDDPTTADVPLVRGGQGRDDWDMEGRGTFNVIAVVIALAIVAGFGSLLGYSLGGFLR